MTTVLSLLSCKTWVFKVWSVQKWRRMEKVLVVWKKRWSDKCEGVRLSEGCRWGEVWIVWAVLCVKCEVQVQKNECSLVLLGWSEWICVVTNKVYEVGETHSDLYHKSFCLDLLTVCVELFKLILISQEHSFRLRYLESCVFLFLWQTKFSSWRSWWFSSVKCELC